MSQSQIVSITSQGQLTIPKSLRNMFGIVGPVKALVSKRGDAIIVQPKKDFWSLAGSLATGVSLSDKELTAARKSFSKKWAKNDYKITK